VPSVIITATATTINNSDLVPTLLVAVVARASWRLWAHERCFTATVSQQNAYTGAGDRQSERVKTAC